MTGNVKLRVNSKQSHIATAKSAIIHSKLTIDTLEQGVKFVQR